MPQTYTLDWDGDAIAELLDEAAVRGLGQAAEHLLQVSRELCPHEEGTLERSGVASVDEGSLQAAVSYDMPYAVRQHEELDWFHKNKGQAKYLEEPANTERDVMLEKVATELWRAVR